VNCSCRRSRAAFRTRATPWDTLTPRGVGCMWEGRAFSLVHARPSPLSADSGPSLCKGILGTITWSDASETDLEAVWPGAFASRSVHFALSDSSEVSRFSGRTCLDGPGVFDDTGSASDSRYCPRPCSLPLQSSRVGPRWRLFDVQEPSPPMPLSTLRRSPHGAHCRTWGQEGSRGLSYRTLAFPISGRCIPALPTLAN
jgi:hypothetical protein